QANMRTEELLAQSQSLAEELQAQQEELTETNKRLDEQAQSLQASAIALQQGDKVARSLGRANKATTGRAPAAERGARREGAAAAVAERGGGAEEPRGRERQAPARRERAPARADVEVQERVPGDHVARAAHAAQFAADPGEALVRKSRGEPPREAYGLRQDDLLVGT